MNADNILAVGNTVGAGNFGSPMQLLILLVIVLLLFGGNRLRNLGGDLGGAIKGFKKAMNDGEKKENDDEELPSLIDANMKLEKIVNPDAPTATSKPRATKAADKVSKPAATEKVAKPRAKAASKPKVVADKE